MNNIERLQNIKESIELMNKNQHIEILDLLIKESVEISENNNGTFVNLTELSENNLDKLEKFIKFVDTQHTQLLHLECEKQTIKKVFFDNIEKKIKIKDDNKIELDG